MQPVRINTVIYDRNIPGISKYPYMLNLLVCRCFRLSQPETPWGSPKANACSYPWGITENSCNWGAPSMGPVSEKGKLTLGPYNSSILILGFTILYRHYKNCQQIEYVSSRPELAFSWYLLSIHSILYLELE